MFISLSVVMAVFLEMMNDALNQLVPEFLRKFPEINVQFVFDGGQGGLISDGVDLSVKITDSPPMGVVARRLFNVNLTVCATPRYINFTECRAILLSWRDIA